MPNNPCDLSVFVVPHKDFDEWVALLRRAHSVLQSLDISYEILVADSGLDAPTRRTIESNQGALIPCATDDYGIRLRTAVHETAGNFMIT
ncbi:MAG TPA: hypothetical protein VGK56_21505, partial [Anaerolineales bacterium]